MTQGTESISKTHRAALGCLAVARQLSVVVMVVSIIALVAGTVGTSYAKTKPPPKNSTEEAVVVTNFGSLFEGSVETFAAGSFFNTGPTRRIKGNATLLGAGTGAAGDAQSSRDGDIAVTVPLASFCGHGALSVWPAGATGNAAPEEFLCGPSTGIFLDQGVAYRDPFTELGVNTTHSVAFVAPNDVIAVSNLGAIVVGSSADGEDCNPFEGELADGPPTVGTITEYLGEQTGNVTPTPNFPVTEVLGPFATATQDPTAEFTNNATIGGCDTALAGPVGLVFDTFGDLFVVNELGKFVTEYAPGASGDAAPINIIGLLGGTAGAFIDPAYIAVGVNPFDLSGDEVIYVTDDGDNSIKIFDVASLFGVQIGTIKGGSTKLKRPQGIYLVGTDLYVVNALTNSLLLFDDLGITGAGNISPHAIVQGVATKMNFPVGVAGPQFFPPAL